MPDIPLKFLKKINEQKKYSNATIPSRVKKKRKRKALLVP